MAYDDSRFCKECDADYLLSLSTLLLLALTDYRLVWNENMLYELQLVKNDLF